MQEKIYETNKGKIHYWINRKPGHGEFTLVFLPGLTADHRLFNAQLDFFRSKYPILVWDPPGHGLSWPFILDFTLEDKARWLEDILLQEQAASPILVGQSMGGYVAQMYSMLYPNRIKGFVSIDSAPLERKYSTDIEIWLLKRMEPVYHLYPWKLLLWSGTRGVSCTSYGRTLMKDMMMTYQSDKSRYARLAGHGFRILAQAIEQDLSYPIPCPAVLIAGKKDNAGSCKRYTRKWHKETGLPLYWIANAGHNANTDAPEEVNKIIENLVEQSAQTAKDGLLTKNPKTAQR